MTSLMIPKQKHNQQLAKKDKEEIICLAKDSTLGYKEIAKSYQIDQSRVSQIARQAGIHRNQRNRKPAKSEPANSTTILDSANLVPDPPLPDSSLEEQLSERYEDIQEELHKWEAIKHDACHKIDVLRKSRQEHYIALQALQRAKENN